MDFTIKFIAYTLSLYSEIKLCESLHVEISSYQTYSKSFVERFPLCKI